MWNDYLEMILQEYSDKPDDFNLSLGHWEPEEFGVPVFRAYMSMTVGELRKLSADAKLCC